MFDTDALLKQIADRMQVHAAERGGLSRLGERSHFEPEFAEALNGPFPGLAEKDRKVSVPCWPNVGRVDAIARSAVGSHGLKVAVELKWAADGQMYEAIWDLFKMALVACRDDVECTFLATGAPVSAWATDPCRALFENRKHEPAALCALRQPRTGRLMWDDALKGGYEGFPAFVPATIHTRHVGSRPMQSGAERWELRLVEVLAPRPQLVEFRQGWPRGERPREARHPLRK